MAHYEGKRYGCSCQNGTCDMNCRMYRIAAGKPSNADRIRAMSDEELARELCRVETGVTTYSEQIYLHWLDWLKQEATDD